MELILDISNKSIKSLFCKDDIYYLIYPSINHNVLRIGSRYISNIISDIDDFEYTYEAHILRQSDKETNIKIFKKKTFQNIKISKSYLYPLDTSSCFHIFPKKADIPDLGFVGTAINTNVKADIVRYNDENYHTIGSIINDNEIKIIRGKYIDSDDNDLCISTYIDNFPKDDNVECVNCCDKEGYLILTYRFYSANILQINGVSIKVAVLGYDETEFKNTVRKPTYAILSCKNNNLLQIDVY